MTHSEAVREQAEIKSKNWNDMSMTEKFTAVMRGLDDSLDGYLLQRIQRLEKKTMSLESRLNRYEKEA